MDWPATERCLRTVVNHYNLFYIVRLVVTLHLLLCLDPLCIVVGIDLIRSVVLYVLGTRGWVHIGKPSGHFSDLFGPKILQQMLFGQDFQIEQLQQQFQSVGKGQVSQAVVIATDQIVTESHEEAQALPGKSGVGATHDTAEQETQTVIFSSLEQETQTGIFSSLEQETQTVICVSSQVETQTAVCPTHQVESQTDFPTFLEIREVSLPAPTVVGPDQQMVDFEVNEELARDLAVSESRLKESRATEVQLAEKIVQVTTSLGDLKEQLCAAQGAAQQLEKSLAILAAEKSDVERELAGVKIVHSNDQDLLNTRLQKLQEEMDEAKEELICKEKRIDEMEICLDEKATEYYAMESMLDKKSYECRMKDEQIEEITAHVKRWEGNMTRVRSGIANESIKLDQSLSQSGAAMNLLDTTASNLPEVSTRPTVDSAMQTMPVRILSDPMVDKEVQMMCFGMTDAGCQTSSPAKSGSSEFSVQTSLHVYSSFESLDTTIRQPKVAPYSPVPGGKRKMPLSDIKNSCGGAMRKRVQFQSEPALFEEKSLTSALAAQSMVNVNANRAPVFPVLPPPTQRAGPIVRQAPFVGSLRPGAGKALPPVQIGRFVPGAAAANGFGFSLPVPSRPVQASPAALLQPNKPKLNLFAQPDPENLARIEKLRAEQQARARNAKSPHRAANPAPLGSVRFAPYPQPPADYARQYASLTPGKSFGFRQPEGTQFYSRPSDVGTHSYRPVATGRQSDFGFPHRKQYW